MSIRLQSIERSVFSVATGCNRLQPLRSAIGCNQLQPMTSLAAHGRHEGSEPGISAPGAPSGRHHQCRPAAVGRCSQGVLGLLAPEAADTALITVSMVLHTPCSHGDVRQRPSRARREGLKRGCSQMIGCNHFQTPVLGCN